MGCSKTSSAARFIHDDAYIDCPSQGCVGVRLQQQPLVKDNAVGSSCGFDVRMPELELNALEIAVLEIAIPRYSDVEQISISQELIYTNRSS